LPGERKPKKNLKSLITKKLKTCKYKI